MAGPARRSPEPLGKEPAARVRGPGRGVRLLRFREQRGGRRPCPVRPSEMSASCLPSSRAGFSLRAGVGDPASALCPQPLLDAKWGPETPSSGTPGMAPQAPGMAPQAPVLTWKGLYRATLRIEGFSSLSLRTRAHTHPSQLLTWASAHTCLTVCPSALSARLPMLGPAGTVSFSSSPRHRAR